MMLFQMPIQVPLEDAVVAAEVSPIDDLGVFVSGVVSAFLTVAAVLAFVYLAYGGLKWLMANGDSGKLEEAKQTLTNAVMGLGVTAAAWAIFLIINHFLGLNVALGGIGGGSGGGSGGGGGTVCTVNTYANAGSVGNYCGSNGNTRMKCVSGDPSDPENISGFTYVHYEPYCCVSGTPNSNFTFIRGGMCS